MTVHVIAWYPSCNCTPILFTCHSSNISIAFVTRWMNRRWWYYRKDLCKGKKRKGGGRGGIIGHPIVLFKGYMGGTKWSAMLMVLIVVLFEREELPFFHSSFFFFHTLSLSLSLFLSIVFPASFEWRIYISIPYRLLLFLLSLSFTHSLVLLALWPA